MLSSGNPLIDAALAGSIAKYKFLEESGADIVHTEDFGQTVLHYAVIGGEIDMVKYLLSKGISPDITDGGGQSPLHIACRDGKIDIINEFIAKGANINVADNNKETPLHQAAWSGRYAIVELLLQKGAIQSSKNEWGQTAEDQAREWKHHKVGDLIKNYIPPTFDEWENLENIVKTQLADLVLEVDGNKTESNTEKTEVVIDLPPPDFPIISQPENKSNDNTTIESQVIEILEKEKQINIEVSGNISIQDELQEKVMQAGQDFILLLQQKYLELEQQEALLNEREERNKLKEEQLAKKENDLYIKDLYLQAKEEELEEKIQKHKKPEPQFIESPLYNLTKPN